MLFLERDLEQHIGRYVSLGEAVIFVEGTCTPCNTPDKDSGKVGFEGAFAEGRGGVRAMVVSPGFIAVGLELAIVRNRASVEGYDASRAELETEGSIWRIDGQLRGTSFPLGHPDSYISEQP